MFGNNRLVFLSQVVENRRCSDFSLLTQSISKNCGQQHNTFYSTYLANYFKSKAFNNVAAVI
ncbi:MAG: hypothetical protein CL939_02110 [Deltaproteobacteria bacterium]|nr:hypothetical protein [Deltaproteobacteria bacterium]